MAAARRGGATAGSGVVSAAGNGLVVFVFLAVGLRGAWQLSLQDVARGAALFLAIMALALRALSQHHPFPVFGPANQITTLRAALVALVGSLAGAPAGRSTATAAVVLSLLATLLDGVDGWFARRTRMVSAFGARFDMEVDALLILLLSLLAWRHEKAGAWVVLSGLLRYAFIAAGWVSARMRQTLPPSRRRQTVCVVQVVALIAVMLPSVTPPTSVAIAGSALAALAVSFALDTAWLLRPAPAARRPAGA